MASEQKNKQKCEPSSSTSHKRTCTSVEPVSTSPDMMCTPSPKKRSGGPLTPSTLYTRVQTAQPNTSQGSASCVMYSPLKAVPSPKKYITSPSPKKAVDLGVFKANFQNFHSKLETQCKANLYDLTTGDVTSVSNGIKNLIEDNKAFMFEAIPMLDSISRKQKALEQKLNYVQDRNLHLKKRKC